METHQRIHAVVDTERYGDKSEQGDKQQKGTDIGAQVKNKMTQGDGFCVC